MSAKPKKDSAGPGLYAVEGLTGMIQDWEEQRRVRDMGGGNRQMSEFILEQITGKWTAFELIQGMLNEYEKEAETTLQIWRESLGFSVLEEDPASRSRDVSREIFKFHELLRAVMATGDKDLIHAWLAERSWSERILIPLMLSQKPSHAIVTF